MTLLYAVKYKTARICAVPTLPQSFCILPTIIPLSKSHHPNKTLPSLCSSLSELAHAMMLQATSPSFLAWSSCLVLYWIPMTESKRLPGSCHTWWAAKGLQHPTSPWGGWCTCTTAPSCTHGQSSHNAAPQSCPAWCCLWREEWPFSGFPESVKAPAQPWKEAKHGNRWLIAPMICKWTL